MKEARPQGAARHDTITRRNINAQQPTVPSVSLNDDLQPQADCNSGTASSYVVFSGGTAANDFVTAFRSRETSFVLPGALDPERLLSSSVAHRNGAQYPTMAARARKSSASLVVHPSATFARDSSA